MKEHPLLSDVAMYATHVHQAHTSTCMHMYMCMHNGHVNVCGYLLVHITVPQTAALSQLEVAVCGVRGEGVTTDVHATMRALAHREEMEAEDVIDAECLELQHHWGQVAPLHLWHSGPGQLLTGLLCQGDTQTDRQTDRQTGRQSKHRGIHVRAATHTQE